jgi:hypothetical protein
MGARIECCLLEDVLAELRDFPEIKLVKIDTDGFDIPILMSSRAVLARSHPVIFLEFDPRFFADEVWGVFRKALLELGYSFAISLRNDGEYDRKLAVNDFDGWQDLVFGFREAGSRGYVDLAVFPAEDSDLAEEYRRLERAATLTIRRSKVEP